MLELDRQTGLLTNLNLRAEKHGDENVSGADMKIVINVSNDILAEFHPRLKAAFYRAPDPGEMDMVDEANAANGTPDLTRLAFGSKVAKLGWSDEFPGMQTVVHYGIGGSDIELANTTADKFEFEFMDGGAVVITFRIRSNPDEKQIGKLATLIGSEIEFSLTGPEEGPIK